MDIKNLMSKTVNVVHSVASDIPDSVGITVSGRTTIYAGLTGIVSSVAHWNWPAIIASTVAILGLGINYYFLRRRDKREQEEREERKAERALRIAALKEGKVTYEN